MNYVYKVSVGLFDSEDYLIQNFDLKLSSNQGYIARDGGFLVPSIIPKPQRKYLSDEKNHTVYFTGIKMNDLNNGMKIKITDAKTEIFTTTGRVYKKPVEIFDITEFQPIN